MIVGKHPGPPSSVVAIIHTRLFKIILLALPKGIHHNQLGVATKIFVLQKKKKLPAHRK